VLSHEGESFTWWNTAYGGKNDQIFQKFTHQPLSARSGGHGAREVLGLRRPSRFNARQRKVSRCGEISHNFLANLRPRRSHFWN